MAEVKRVSDQYTISSPSIVLEGNLTIQGSTTTVNTVNSTINDNLIVLNSGETGAGVIAGTAGIEIERGSLTNVAIIWDESTDKWKLTNDGSTYENILTGVPGAVVAPGSDTWVVYNASGSLGAEAAFAYNRTTNVLTVDNINIGTNTIAVTNTNGNLTLSANGTGIINVTHGTALQQLGSAPSSVAGSSVVYGAAPGAGASGVYVVNSVMTDELIAKRRALMLSLIM